MTRLIQAVFLALIFQHAFCCFSQMQTKPELCSNLQSNPQQMERMLVGNVRMQDLREFCNSDSVRDPSNGICERLPELAPQLPASLAGNLTEFCNPAPQIQADIEVRYTDMNNNEWHCIVQ